MPFRTKNTYSTPGGGTVTRSKSGKAKTYSGKGPAPAGTKKVREPTAATAPTTIVHSDGSVTTTGMHTAQEMAVAVQAHERGRKRVERIRQEENRKAAAAIASVNRRQNRRQRERAQPRKAPQFVPAGTDPTNPATAVISSRPNPTAKPAQFGGKPTAGEPTRKELAQAKRQGTLKVNPKGFVTTPAVRQAAQQLRQVQTKIRKHGPDLSNLSPAEQEVAHLAIAAHRKYPHYPIPVAMAQVKQESGFNAAAVSSAGAQGLTQFIPSTAQTYGVQYGTGKREKRSQVFGQFKLMEDDLKQYGSVTGALNAYLGLAGQSTPSEYSSNILAMAKDYKGVGHGAVPKGLRKDLQAARARAQRVGLKAGAPKQALGPAPPQVVTKYKAIKKLAKGIEKLDIPYVYGGGHNGGMPDPSEGLDCSSSTVFLLRKAGYDVPNITSGEFGNYFPSGPGAVTIFYNPTHVFLRIGNEYWGTSAGDSGSGGLGKHPAPSAAYLSQYSVAHVPGLGKKQALQLGLTNLAGGSGGSFNTEAFPGMTLSPDGATATIAPGQGAKQGKAGFSKKPISLTPLQRYNRTKRKLNALGVGQKKADQGTTHPILEELIQKYGSAEPNPTEAKERRRKAALAAATK